MRDAFVVGKVSVYSAGEQAIMDISQQLRGQIFIPLLPVAVLLLAPVLSCLASWVPAMLAARQDPAVVLAEE